MRSRLFVVPRHVTPRVAWVVVVSVLGFLFVSPLVRPTGAGQLRTDATIIGQVTDESAACFRA